MELFKDDACDIRDYIIIKPRMSAASKANVAILDNIESDLGIAAKKLKIAGKRSAEGRSEKQCGSGTVVDPTGVTEIIVPVSLLLLVRPFPYLLSGHFPCSPVLSSCTYSCLRHVFSYNIVLITTFSAFVNACPNHLCLASLIFPFMFATPAHALISSVLIFYVLV